MMKMYNPTIYLSEGDRLAILQEADRLEERYVFTGSPPFNADERIYAQKVVAGRLALKRFLGVHEDGELTRLQLKPILKVGHNSHLTIRGGKHPKDHIYILITMEGHELKLQGWIYSFNARETIYETGAGWAVPQMSLTPIESLPSAINNKPTPQ